MQFKLKEIYNTRYLYLPYVLDLNYLFSNIVEIRKNPNHECNAGNALLEQVYNAARVGSPLEFDLADVKLTPDTVRVINNYALQGVMFTDTKDSLRASILRTNRERMAIDKSSYIDLPHYDMNVLVKDYVASLTKDVTYCMPATDSDIYIPLVYIISTVRPSVKLCIGNHSNTFFNFIGSRLPVSLIEKYDEFYFTTKDGTMIVKFVNGKTTVQRYSVVDIEEALTIGTLVPTIFGKERIYKEDGWSSIFKECLDSLNHYRNTRKQTLSELF